MKELVLCAGNLSATVLPQVAGRVATLAFRGRQLFVGADVHPDNWGSTYWTSPQSTWGWPPVAAIDSAPFEVVEQEPLTLRGPLASLGGTELRLVKRFVALPGKDALRIEYELENEGHAALAVAGWEISRVGAGGLTFYATGENELTPVEPHAELVPLRANGHSFFDHATFVAGRSSKVHADASAGYLAHVPADDGAGPRLLFLKKFEDTTPDQQAPGEGEVEIFSNEDGRYVEVEVQGRYAVLEPGQRQVFRVEWSVHELPTALAVSVDSPALVEFVRSLC